VSNETELEDPLSGDIYYASRSNTSLNTHNNGLFARIDDVTLKIGRLEIDYLPVLRASCIIFLGICAIWLFSLCCLALSLRFEILDLVYINTLFLAVATAYALIQALSTGVLLFYQTEYHWPVLLLICGVVGGLILCFAFLCVALAFLVVWYRYIDYMNGDDETCLCTSTIYNLIKSGGKRGRRQHAAADYSIPEATHHANLPYIDDPPVQQFSNF
jgi:hypothetical protein